jgi:hypothetical protein
MFRKNHMLLCYPIAMGRSHGHDAPSGPGDVAPGSTSGSMHAGAAEVGREEIDSMTSILRRWGPTVAALLLMVGLAGRAEAGLLFAVSGSGGSPSNLYTVDTTTGAATLVGATGFSHVTALSFDPTTGSLYGHVSDIFNTGTQLIAINAATGAGSAIGSTGQQIPDMAFDSSGQLYAWSEFGSSSFDNLFTIDKATGAATLVGASGIGTFNTGLAFDNMGTLYVKPSGVLYTVDKTTGAATFVEALGTPLNNALAFDPNTNVA